MDDIVVLILTLLIFVLGAIGQIKKKRSAQTNTGQNNKPGSFWDLLEGEPEFVEQPEEFNPVVEPQQSEIIKKETEYKFTPSNEGKTNIYDEIVEDLKEEKKKEKILDENFSLRKAIIYSEIINRKYT